MFIYRVVYEPMVITSSCLDNASKKLVRQQLSILGGHMIGEWTSDCSIVVMNKISVTIKVSLTLEQLINIEIEKFPQSVEKFDILHILKDSFLLINLAESITPDFSHDVRDLNHFIGRIQLMSVRHFAA